MTRLRLRLKSLQWRSVERADFQSPGAIAVAQVRRAMGKGLAPTLRRRLDEQWPSTPEPYRLHLGCGSIRLPGWINIDNRTGNAVDVKWDLRWGIPLPTASVALYYSEHLFEHMALLDGRALLRDCHHTLAPGGTIRIAMPDVAATVHNYTTGEWRSQPWLDSWPCHSLTRRPSTSMWRFAVGDTAFSMTSRS